MSAHPAHRIPAPVARPGRRRVHLVAAGVVLLVVLAVVAFGVVFGGGPGPSTPPPAPHGQSSTATSKAPTPHERGGTFDLTTGVEDGAPLTLPYLVGARLVQPDALTLELPREYDGFALLGDQVVASYDDRGDRRLDLLSPSGSVEDSSLLAGDVAVDATGGLVAWATASGELVARWATGGLSFDNHGGSVTVAAVTGEPPCSRRSDCRIFVNHTDGRAPRSVAADGSVTAVAPGAIKVNDVRADGLTAVQISSSDTGSCSAVYDAWRGEYLWKTCQNSLFAFSPDGRYLLASDPYLDGLGLGSLSVLEARTGDMLAKFTIRGGFIAQQTWEDDTHPLVVVSGPNGWQVLRLGLDGTRKRALGPVAAGTDPTHRPVTLMKRG